MHDDRTGGLRGREMKSLRWDKVRALEKLYREYPWAVSFWNPGISMTVDTGWNSWADAMARCAHYTHKYGQFDGFEKPRIRATGRD